MNMLTTNKDLKKILRDAQSEGWSFSYSKGNHLKGRHTTGKVVVISRTPSDWHAIDNIKRDLKIK